MGSLLRNQPKQVKCHYMFMIEYNIVDLCGQSFDEKTNE